MTTRRINSLLYLTAGVLSAGAVALIAVVLLPIEASSAIQNNAVAREATTKPLPSADDAEKAMLAKLEPVLSRPLRGTLAIAAPAPVAAPPPRPVPQYILVGTIGGSTAMLRTPEGAVVAKSVGERMGDAVVTAVRDGQADLRIGGRIMTLRKAGEPTPP